MSGNSQLIIFTFIAACYAGNAFSGDIGAAGTLEQAATEVDSCPTFNWSGNQAATDYELAVFEDSGDGYILYEEMIELSDPVISTKIQAPGLSWTPSGDECLEEGSSYVWFIRELLSEGAGDWSIANSVNTQIRANTPRISVVGEFRTIGPCSWVNCRGIFRHDGSGGLIINSHTGGTWADIDFQTNGQTRMHMHHDGKLDIGGNVVIGSKLGIGIMSALVPTAFLDINTQDLNTTLLQISSGFFPTETRLIVEGGGTVGINTPTPNNSYKLHVNGAAASIGWTNLSSRQYKEDIKKIPTDERKQMLDRLMSMDLTSYRYKQAFGGDDSKKLGFIAEEMPGEVLSKDGKGVDIYALLSYTIGAIQEQQREIIEVAELKAENRTLRAQTEELKQLVCQDHPQAQICM